MAGTTLAYEAARRFVKVVREPLGKPSYGECDHRNAGVPLCLESLPREVLSLDNVGSLYSLTRVFLLEKFTLDEILVLLYI
jgi:hypothetical protein